MLNTTAHATCMRYFVKRAVLRASSICIRRRRITVTEYLLKKKNIGNIEINLVKRYDNINDHAVEVVIDGKYIFVKEFLTLRDATSLYERKISEYTK